MGSQHQDPPRNQCKGRGQPPSRDDVREAVDRPYAADPRALNAANTAQTQRVHQRGAGTAAAMDIPEQWAQNAPQSAARLEQCQAPQAAAQDATPSAALTQTAPSPLREGVPEQLVGISEIEFLRSTGRLR